MNSHARLLLQTRQPTLWTPTRFEPTCNELDGRLKVSERWVYQKSRRRRQNPLPTIHLGRYLRFDWIGVSAWLRQQERAA